MEKNIPTIVKRLIVTSSIPEVITDDKEIHYIEYYHQINSLKNFPEKILVLDNTQDYSEQLIALSSCLDSLDYENLEHRNMLKKYKNLFNTIETMTFGPEDLTDTTELDSRKDIAYKLDQEYDQIIDSYIKTYVDPAIIQGFKEEFDQLPENYQLSVEVNLYVKGCDDGIGLFHIYGTGSNFTIDYNTKAGKRTFELKPNRSDQRKSIKSLFDIKDCDQYIKRLSEKVNSIKELSNKNLNAEYIISIEFSKGNTGYNNLPKLKEICSKVFQGRAKSVGKKSDYNLDMVQHYQVNN